MPQDVAFDLYDDRWRDCWVAATSTARLRKKQVDFDIQQRVAKLLQEFGPQTEKALTLRIYGTMLKGFCVINNERARCLFAEGERVVLMFARQPFDEGDNKVRLPAAKRHRMEAALTLELDLARVEAAEAFDWTQAPLEEGALLRLGGGQQLQEAFLPSSLDLAEQAMPQLLDPRMCEVSARQDEGWLPKFGEGVGEPVAPLDAQHAEAQRLDIQMQDPVMSQLAAMGAEQPQLGEQFPGHPAEQQPGLDLEALAHRAAKRQRSERAAAALLRPGLVYGFDQEPMMTSRQYEEWQHDSNTLCRARMQAARYAEELEDDFERADHLGPRLRLLLDPTRFLREATLKKKHPVPDVQTLLGDGKADFGFDEVAPPLPEEVAQADAGDALMAAHIPDQEDSAFPHATASEDTTQMFVGLGSVEAQDDRTAQVCDIIRSCMRTDGHGVLSFDHLVPPGQADRATAACTFASLLALATAGELTVQQAEPYASILISEVR
eukprot:TRINITY_DN60511_c0_g1_i1.p1 TRINITY_DN60511_c0_g1~~TRINITY_DN60511_c0_g1_i1.p1  ORF type:complete len:493 (-),score=107.88 TRINITY_DN60511_c0_g1_i1:228-1706(-)